MDWGGPAFVLCLIAIPALATVATTWIRAHHGYALDDEDGGRTERADSAAAQTLRAENAQLSRRLAALESRAAALETIVTDSGYGLGREIEELRRPLPAGVHAESGR